MPQNQNTEKLVDAIEKLAFIIDTSKNSYKDNSQIFMNILVSLREIGNAYNDNGCMGKIYHELQILNRTIIMSALLLSATKNPEKTLNEYKNIIEQYLK